MMMCRKCGACCRHLIIEVTERDAEREPRIREKASKLDGHGLFPDSDFGPDDPKYLLAAGYGCLFLEPGGACSIYETRPDVCREFTVDCDQCFECRSIDVDRARKAHRGGKE